MLAPGFRKEANLREGGFITRVFLPHSYLHPETPQSFPKSSGKQKESRTGQVTEENRAEKLKEKKGEEGTKELESLEKLAWFTLFLFFPVGQRRSLDQGRRHS